MNTRVIRSEYTGPSEYIRDIDYQNEINCNGYGNGRASGNGYANCRGDGAGFVDTGCGSRDYDGFGCGMADGSGCTCPECIEVVDPLTGIRTIEIIYPCTS